MAAILPPDRQYDPELHQVVPSDLAAALRTRENVPTRFGNLDEVFIALGGSPATPMRTAAFTIGGRAADGARRRAVSYLKGAHLHHALEELEEIEERLSSGRRVAYKHAADSTRRLLREVADHQWPARAEPYVDRWGKEREVGAEHVINRLLAFLDEQAELSAPEQKAMGAELFALWRSVATEVHELLSKTDAKHSYLRLLRALAAFDQATR